MRYVITWPHPQSPRRIRRDAPKQRVRFAGMDIHPVAVIIARVTYLLALGESLTTREGDISIPVYVGDAMQLSVSSMFAGRELIIQVPGTGNGDERDMLRFPETVCRNPHLLDNVVERMRLSSEQGIGWKLRCGGEDARCP